MFSRAVISARVWVPASEVSEEARASCSVCPISFGKPVENVFLGEDRGDWFGFPRHWFDGRPAKTMQDISIHGEAIDFEMTAVLTPEQREATLDFESLFVKGATGFVLDANTAFGKTVTLIQWIQIIGRTALVIVPKSDLVKQWIDRFVEHTSLRRDDIGYVNGRKTNWKGKYVVIGLAHSVAKDRLGKEFRHYFGQVWFDEVHAALPPDTFAPLPALFPAKYRGGCTATPDRVDGRDRIFEASLQEVKIVGQDSNRVKPVVFAAKYAKTCGPIPPIDAMQRRGIFLTAIGLDDARNNWLSAAIRALHRKGHRVAVISDRTQQLFLLRDLIARWTDRVGFYCRSILDPEGKTRSVSNKEIEETAERADIILATFGLFKLGTDIPTVSALVYATPQADIRQSKGRIERIWSGKKKPVILDITDVCYEDAKRWSWNRMRQYAKDGLTVRRIGACKFG